MSPDNDSDELTQSLPIDENFVAYDISQHEYHETKLLSKAQCRRLKQKERLERYKDIPFSNGLWPSGYLKAEREYCKLAEKMFYECRTPKIREMLRAIVLARRAEFFGVWKQRQEEQARLNKDITAIREL